MKQRIIFAVLISLLMSFLMTCWITWIHLGFTQSFIWHWFKAFLLAWPAAGTIAFFAGPEIHKLSVRLSDLRASER